MKRLFCIVIVFILSVSGCNQMANVDSFINKKDNNIKILLSQLEEENISIYAIEKAESDLYTKLELDIRGKIKSFNWENLTNEAYAPILIYKDITGDNTNELTVILSTASGTGVAIKEVHILDPNNFNEIKVENPADIIENHVTSSILPDRIEIIVDGKKNVIAKNALGIDESHYFQDVSYQNHIKFDVEGNILTAHIGAQVSPTTYVGEIKIQYKFDKDDFKMSAISYNSLLE